MPELVATLRCLVCSVQRLSEMEELKTQLNSMEERHSVLENKVCGLPCYPIFFLSRSEPFVFSQR